MVNAGKKLSDVAFQNPTSGGIVAADFIGHRLKLINRFGTVAEYTCHSRESGNPVATHRKLAKFLDPRIRGDDKSNEFCYLATAPF